jgi:protein-S-isoprenylcysteine O-methyltransferase Ste14
MEAFFRIATAIIFILVFATSAYFRTRADVKGGMLRSNEGQRPVAFLRLLGFVMWLPLVAYILNPELVSSLRVALPDWLRVLALVVIAIDSALVFWMYRSLDTNISPVHEVRANAKLVTSGPYRWIRHPLYTFGFILLISYAVLTGLWWLAFCSLFFFVFIFWRVPKEEAKLIEAFGDDYRNYMKRTGRFIPKFG